MTFTGGNASDVRVTALKTFVAGTSYSLRTHAVADQMRSVLSRDLNRSFAGSVNKAKRNDWIVPAKPIAHLASVSGGTTSKARLCRWTPSTIFMKKDGTAVQRPVKEWGALAITMTRRGSAWVITKVEGDGTCQRSAP